MLCLCTVGPVRMWQHVGGWWLGGFTARPGHRGPESDLAEMFAQLKHYLLRHITGGCQRPNGSMEKRKWPLQNFQH